MQWFRATQKKKNKSSLRQFLDSNLYRHLAEADQIMEIEEYVRLAEWANGKHLALELGTYRCVGSCVLSTVVEKVISVDNYSGDQLMSNKQMLEENGFSNIELINTTSQNYLLTTSQQFDVIHIDADHRLKPVTQDIILSEFRLKAGGVLCGHDYNCPEFGSVKQPVDDLVKPYYDDFEIYITLWKGLKK